mmetsp:Transcript_27771/g.62984  ORF Transcript_27771/g.62984 Transcript_27771/m.62984 type:complete len:253 (+) Transcript_27771:23-781(+)
MEAFTGDEGGDDVRLSVQGHYFIVERTTITSHDWILSKIITSKIPWKKTSDDGQIFLDVDPNSFRLILAIISETIDLSQDLGCLSRSDLVLLKATARYLMLDKVNEQIEDIETGILEEIRTKDEEIGEMRRKFETELRKKDEEIDELQSKADLLAKIEQQIQRLSGKVVKCNAYRTRRHLNECGTQSMILGTLRAPESDREDKDGPCGSCNNDCSKNLHYRFCGQQIQVTSSWKEGKLSIEEFGDLIEFLDC